MRTLGLCNVQGVTVYVKNGVNMRVYVDTNSSERNIVSSDGVSQDEIPGKEGSKEGFSSS